MDDVRRAPTPGARAETENTAVRVLCGPPEGLRLGRRGAAVEGTSAGRREKCWETCLKDDLKAFEAAHDSTDGKRRTFGILEAEWQRAAKVEEGRRWHERMLRGAEKFLAAWHKKEEDASRKGAIKRDKKERKKNKVDTAPTNGGIGKRRSKLGAPNASGRRRTKCASCSGLSS